jgi:hypothetical protein
MKRRMQNDRRFIVQSLLPINGALAFASPHGNAASLPATLPLSPLRPDSIVEAHRTGGSLHDAATRVGAEMILGFSSAWSGGYIGQGVGMLVGALAGTLLLPGVGTAAVEALGGAAGELAGIVGGAVFGMNLGAKVANDIIA